MRILVTGSGGQVGSCLVKQISEINNISLLAVDRAELDITNEYKVKQTVTEFMPDVIINAAAFTAVDKAEQEVELSYAINRDGPKYLAQAAESIGSAILHISTDYVFSGKMDRSYVESDLVGPQSVYGHSKLCGEEEVANACKRHIILRTAWVFGENGNNFVKTILRLSSSKETIRIVADQIGSPTYSEDVAKALIVMAKSIVTESNERFGIYHFAGMPTVSWYEFANEIVESAYRLNLISSKPKIIKITTEEFKTLASRPKNSRLNCSKIERHFGIKPSDWISALNNMGKYKI